jgi:ferredoxin
VKVSVDDERCQGHGRCYATAPEVFGMDDVGYGHELGDGVVPEGLEGKARLAVDNCPEQAITIEDD